MRLIDADALIGDVREHGVLGSGHSDSEREDDVCDMIDNAPTIDAEPVKHGRWIAETKRYQSDPRMHCSACKVVDVPLLRWNYCPNCGAKMDAEVE